MECNCHKTEFAYRVVENGAKCGVKCAVEMQAGEKLWVDKSPGATLTSAGRADCYGLFARF